MGAISVSMGYFDSIANTFIFQFEDVSIAVGNIAYVSYTLPNNFAINQFRLIIDADSYNLDSTNPYNFTQTFPDNGIVNSSISLGSILFNIKRNAHHYLEIQIKVT